MQIGIIDGSLNLPWEKLFDAARQLGFAGVELGVGKDYDKSKLWSAEGRRELAGLSQKTDVAIASLCLHSYWNYSFADPSAVTQKTAAQIATDAAAIARELRAQNILIPLTYAREITPAQATRRWVDRVQRVAPAAERAGVVFCLENVGQPFAKNAQQVADLVDAIGSPAVKVYYDPGNALSAGLDPLREIPLLGPRIAQVHIKEIGADLLGQGKMKFKSILAALRDIGYDGWLVLETPATSDPVKSQAANLSYLEALLAA